MYEDRIKQLEGLLGEECSTQNSAAIIELAHLRQQTCRPEYQRQLDRLARQRRTADES